MRTYLVAKGNGLAHNKLFRQCQLTWELSLVTTIFRRGGVTFQMGVFEENRICFFLLIYNYAIFLNYVQSFKQVSVTNF